MTVKQSAFMHWAKTRPKVKFDLALSVLQRVAELVDSDQNLVDVVAGGVLGCAEIAHGQTPSRRPR